VSVTTVSKVWPDRALADSSGLEVRTMITLPSGSTIRVWAESAGTAVRRKHSVVIRAPRDFVGLHLMGMPLVKVCMPISVGVV
jgi:hypothetical protein